MSNGEILNGQKPKLLLVDDDDLIRATLGNELKNAGYEVLLADGGKEALKIISNEPKLNLAILDIKMKGMSGIELAQKLKPLGIFWIFLSSYDDKAYVKQATDEGALSYLVKPIDPQKVIPSIEAALKRSRDLIELRDTAIRLEQALATGKQVNVAVGMIMERRVVDEHEAFDLIRNKARSEQRKVKDVSEEILNAWHITNFLPNKNL